MSVGTGEESGAEVDTNRTGEGSVDAGEWSVAGIGCLSLQARDAKMSAARNTAEMTI